MGDAESAQGRGKVGTTRAILAYALKVFPDRENLWWKAAKLEKTHGTWDSQRDVGTSRPILSSGGGVAVDVGEGKVDRRGCPRCL